MTHSPPNSKSIVPVIDAGDTVIVLGIFPIGPTSIKSVIAGKSANLTVLGRLIGGSILIIEGIDIGPKSLPMQGNIIGGCRMLR